MMQAQRPKRVLFICVENSNRSQMAEAVARMFGEGRVVEFDVAVTMGCGDECPALRVKRRLDWDIPCPKGMPPDQFRVVRGQIKEMVKELLANFDLVLQEFR